MEHNKGFRETASFKDTYFINSWFMLVLYIIDYFKVIP